MKLAEHEGLPPEINILLSLGIGITVTKVAGKYLLKDAKGAVLGEIHEPTEDAEEIVYSPINPGPLDESVANTFRSGTYTRKALAEDTTFYRVHGGKAGKVGSFIFRTPQHGGMQSQFDLALNPDWGNTATDVTKVTVPKGTVIYEGVAASQTINGGAGVLMGGGNQVYIPKGDLNPLWFGK